MSPSSESAVERQPPSEIVGKLQWLMFFRLVMFTLLLGSVLAFDYAKTETPQWTLIGLVVAIYVLTIVYSVALKRMRRGFESFAYAQLLIDLLSSVALVTLTGGTESLFIFTFSLTVLAASILLYRRGALYTSAVATALIVGLVAREAMGWGIPSGPAEGDQLRSIFLHGVTNVTAVFLVALLAGYLSEQLRAAGQQLRFASADIEALKALNEHIITSIQSGLVSYTLDDKIIFFNPAASKITGLETADVLFRSVASVFPGVRDHESSGDDSLSRWEQAFVRPDGSRRVLGFSLSPLLDAHRAHQGWILIFQDLSPIREMEERIRRSEQFAAIGKMAAGIAHEIRNPLASMSGSIQMLSQSSTLDPMSEKLMRIVMRETDRLNALITDFLHFARPKEPEFSRFPLRPLVQEVIEVFAYLHFQDTEAQLDVDVQVPTDLEVTADPQQLKQVVWNLFNNAAEAMENSGVVSLSAACDDRGAVEIRVQDSGCGITDEVRDRIFDPFFTTKDSGSGLGLAQVLRIVEDHGGELLVESVPDAGSTFVVRLPESQKDSDTLRPASVQEVA